MKHNHPTCFVERLYDFRWVRALEIGSRLAALDCDPGLTGIALRFDRHLRIAWSNFRCTEGVCLVQLGGDRLLLAFAAGNGLSSETSLRTSRQSK
jgi:hypothetical protein